MGKLRSLEEEFKLMGHVLSESFMKGQEMMANGKSDDDSDADADKDKDDDSDADADKSDDSEGEKVDEMSPGSPDDVAKDMPKKKDNVPQIGTKPVGSKPLGEKANPFAKKDDDKADDDKDDSSDEKSDDDGDKDDKKPAKPFEKKDAKDKGKFAAKVDQKPSDGPDKTIPKKDLPADVKRAGMESTDKLDLLMSELQKLSEGAGEFDSDKKRLTRIFSNISVVADVLSQRLAEGDEVGASLDKLAEDALLVAEGVTYGKIPLENARGAVKGYVKDLTAAMSPIAGELDEELDPKPAPRLLVKK